MASIISSAGPDDVEISDDEEDDTLNYFEHVVSKLQGLLICDVPEDIIRTIVFLINFTKRLCTDWKLYVTDMLDEGDGHFMLKLAEIQGTADSKMVLPLYVALSGPLGENKTMASLVKSLIKRNRLDVLREIRSYVEDYIRKVESNENRSMEHNINSEQNSCVSGDSYVKTQQLHVILPKSSVEDDSLKKSSVSTIKHVSDFKHSSYSLSIFIPHSDKDTVVVQKLAKLLDRKYNISVKLLCDIQHLIVVGGCEVLYAILKEVDFVVPCISNEYLKSIRLTYQFKTHSDSVKTNRLIYQWLLSEYMDNGSLNLRVRPLLLPGVDIRCVKTLQIPLFSFLFEVPGDIAKLVKIMIDTKRDMPLLMNYHKGVIS